MEITKRFFFKSETLEGDRCKTYVDLYDNGNFTIYQLRLSACESLKEWCTVLRKFKGKYLYMNLMPIKAESFLTIFKECFEVYEK